MRTVLLAAALLGACGPAPRSFTVEIVEPAAPPEATGVVKLGAGEDFLRFKSYDGVLHGSAGIRYVKDAALKPERLAAAEDLAREMRLMAPIFARGRSIPLPFEPPTDGWSARAWTWRGRDYLVLANATRDRQWKMPAAVLTFSWRPLFERRRDPRELLKEHGGSFYLRPFQVLVLESRLRPRRMLGLSR